MLVVCLHFWVASSLIILIMKFYVIVVHLRRGTSLYLCLHQGKMGKRTYVVFVGRKPGIYHSWGETSCQVNGFKNAIFKSYGTEKEAHEAFSKHLEGQGGPFSKGRTYVVFIGRKRGLYKTWEEAKTQVNGYRNAVYQAFNTEEDAVEAFLKYSELNIQHADPVPVPAPVHDSADYEELDKRLEEVPSELDTQHVGPFPFPAPVHDRADYEELEKRLEKALAERDTAFKIAGVYAEMLHEINSLDLSD